MLNADIQDFPNVGLKLPPQMTAGHMMTCSLHSLAQSATSSRAFLVPSHHPGSKILFLLVSHF